MRIAGAKGDHGGVWFEGPLEMGIRVCLHARVAVRVLVRLGTFDAPDAKSLYAGARAIAWTDWLTAKSAFAVHASVRDTPALTHSGFVALKVKDAVADALRDALGARPDVDTESPDVGIVLFGYYNPIFVHGEARTVTEAARAGVDALLVVDLPVEESGPLRELGRQAGVGLVPLLAPTSSAARVAAVRSAAEGGSTPFVYYVSVTGVTGSAAVDAAGAGHRAASLKAELGLPVVVGFGIDGRDKAREAAAEADGVVAGTALVRLIEEQPSPASRLSAVEALVRELRAGVDEA